MSGSSGGLQSKTPAGLRRRGLGILCFASLPDPRRRVRYDAYDDHTYDDRQHCTGSVGTEAADCGHGDSDERSEIEVELLPR